MKFLRQLCEAETVDITQSHSRDEIAKAWPDGVTYNGINVFNAVYEADFVEQFTRLLQQENSDLESFDAQESYLGYIPKGDVFIMGFDTWGEEPIGDPGGDVGYDNDEEEDEYEMAEDITNLVAFKIDDRGRVHNARPINVHGRMMYGRDGVHSRLEKKYPDLVDIRLD